LFPAAEQGDRHRAVDLTWYFQTEYRHGASPLLRLPCTVVLREHDSGRRGQGPGAGNRVSTCARTLPRGYRCARLAPIPRTRFASMTRGATCSSGVQPPGVDGACFFSGVSVAGRVDKVSELVRLQISAVGQQAGNSLQECGPDGAGGPGETNGVRSGQLYRRSDCDGSPFSFHLWVFVLRFEHSSSPSCVNRDGRRRGTIRAGRIGI